MSVVKGSGQRPAWADLMLDDAPKIYLATNNHLCPPVLHPPPTSWAWLIWNSLFHQRVWLSWYPGLCGSLRTPLWPLDDSIYYRSASASYTNWHNTPCGFLGSTNYLRASDEIRSHSSLQPTPPQGTLIPASRRKVELGRRVPVIAKGSSYTLGFL